MPHVPLGERLRRFFLSHEELEAEELRDQAHEAGAEPLAQAKVRSRVTVVGTVTSVTSDAASGWLEAAVSDGTGSVRLVWMGRSRIECLLPGRTVRVSGRLARDHGDLVIYNPDFEILP